MSTEPPDAPLVHVTINGKSYPVYPPTAELWRKLRNAEEGLKTQGYLEEVEPGLFRAGALGVVADECCRLPESGPFDRAERARQGLPPLSAFGRTWTATHENIGAIMEIIDTWDIDYFHVAHFYGFVLECAKRTVFRLEEVDRRIDLIRNRHPELREEAIAAGTSAAAYEAPIPPDLYETEDEATQLEKAARPAEPSIDTASEHDQLVTLAQAAGMAHRDKRTLERYKTKGTLPSPAVEGGGGRPDLYDWKTIGPWLESTFGVKQPARFPASRRS